MKRTFLGALLATLLSVPVGAQIQLSAPNLKVSPGGSVVVPITINPPQGTTAIQLNLEYDSALLGVAHDESVIKGDSLADHAVGIRREPGVLRLVILSASLSSLKPASGALINVIFRASSASRPGGTSALRIRNAQAADTEGNRVSVSAYDGSILITTQPAEPVAGTNRILFPQIANGSFPGGSYATTLIFVNRTGVQTPGQVRFFKSNGTAMEVRMTDGQSGSAFSFQAPDRGAVLLQTDGSGPLTVGFAQLTANGPMGGTVLFTQKNDEGRAIGESGVGGETRQSHFGVPLLFVRDQADTGIAFANATGYTASLTLKLRDENGTVLATQTISLGPGQHLPQFASEFFPLLRDRMNFIGSIEVLSSTPIGAIALKLQGTLLTTFPVVEIR